MTADVTDIVEGAQRVVRRQADARVRQPQTADETPAAAGVQSEDDRGVAPQDPPTEAEIRQALQNRLEYGDGYARDEDWIAGLTSP